MPDKWFRKDLIDHKARVAEHMGHATAILLEAAVNHDVDKIENEVIFQTYSRHAKHQKATPWGTHHRKDYELKHMNEAIELHLQNKHHLQDARNTREDIDIFDVIEMMCDWFAAMERDLLTKDQQFERAKQIYDKLGYERLHIDEMVYLNTAKRLIYYK